SRKREPRPFESRDDRRRAVHRVRDPVSESIANCCDGFRVGSSSVIARSMPPDAACASSPAVRVGSRGESFWRQGEALVPNIKIAVINESTVVSDADVKAAVAALQKQVSRDFAPAWGIDASLTFVPFGGNPSPDAWWLVILDNSDQAGALGYHDLTT